MKSVQLNLKEVIRRKRSIYEPRGRCINCASWKKHSFILLAQSNAFRQKIHESEANEQSLYEQAHSLKQKLKFMEWIKFQVA